MDVSIPNLLMFPVFAKFSFFSVVALALSLLIAVFIMAHYDGDWNSFIWYIINEIVVGIGFMFFIVPGLILWIIWAKRAGIIVAILGGFLGIFGAAIGSSFGYESEGFLR